MVRGLMILSIFTFQFTVTSCSTTKNTWATRSFHQTKVKYNILYNGNVAYEEGLKAIRDANTDDYSRVLYLYPVSNHQAAESAASQMDKTIEKCRKCIKLHSIKSKPKRDPKKANDPKYKLWLQNEEFNKNMHLAWIRLGQAEFHKGDFLGAVSTFNYIIRHYQNDPDMVAQCQLWTARAYAEMGWQYEAEDMLNRVQIDALSRKHAPLYSAVKADVFLKGEHYHEAIPFVKLAMPYEKRKIYRPRFAYVLGQLYERENKRDDAIAAYKSAIRMAPPNEMEFNARIRVAELGGKGSLHQLRTMSKQAKYKDRLDRIYGAMGNIYLADRDTAKALELYEKAIAESTQPGDAKSAVLVKAGDIYFEMRDYVHAQPCYREAVTILTAEHNDYARVQKRSEVLDELILAYNQAVLQDSLQHLGQLTEEEQRAIVDKIIADLVEAEKQDSIRQAQEARELAHGDSGPRSVNTANMLGGGGQKGEWYFYNPQLIKQGKQEWYKRWGNRPLEDNWRRQNKQVVINDEGMNELMNEGDSTLLANDSTSNPLTTNPLSHLETDIHKPEYYLQQIPKTEQDYAVSDSLWREAMIALYYIYRDKLEDEELAELTLHELVERFTGHPSLDDIFKEKQLRALRNDSAYIARMQGLLAAQDTLYAETYKAYTKGEYGTVKANAATFKKAAEQPENETVPQRSGLASHFAFLNAVAIARTDGQEPFVEALQQLVADYGDTELGAMAKDMLAMLGQGMESRKGGATGDLAQMRGQIEDEKQDTVAQQEWSEDRKQPSVVLLILPTADEERLNELLYEVALFNFSQFLIRDFDLQKMPVFGEGCALRISGFADMDEAEWWINLIQAAQPAPLNDYPDIQIKAVTEMNLPLLK
jgi:tetratricopeptide (TPR) repeat protein